MPIFNYKTSLSNFEKGEKPCYRIIPITNGVKQLKQVAASIAAKTGVSADVCKYVCELFLAQLGKELEKGNRVEVENLLTGGLTVKGLFDSANAPWDGSKNKVDAQFQVKGDLRKAYDGVESQNITEGNRVVVRRVLDTVLKENGKIQCGENVTVYISGLNLGVDGTQEDEGCWLEDIKTGTVVATSEFLASTMTTLDVKFLTTPAPGKYNIVVASRGGLGPEYGVSTARRVVDVVEV